MNHILGFIVAMQLRLEQSRDDRGATATEYALLVAFIAIVLVGGVTLFGGQLRDFFNSLGGQIGIVSGN